MDNRDLYIKTYNMLIEYKKELSKLVSENYSEDIHDRVVVLNNKIKEISKLLNVLSKHATPIPGDQWNMAKREYPVHTVGLGMFRYAEKRLYPLRDKLQSYNIQTDIRKSFYVDGQKPTCERLFDYVELWAKCDEWSIDLASRKITLYEYSRSVGKTHNILVDFPSLPEWVLELHFKQNANSND